MIKAFVQEWWEFERGWGSRPDGFSIHRTREEYQKYFNDMRAKEKSIYGDRVPDCYITPEGELKQVELTPQQIDLLPDPGEVAAWLPQGLVPRDGKLVRG